MMDNETLLTTIDAAIAQLDLTIAQLSKRVAAQDKEISDLKSLNKFVAGQINRFTATVEDIKKSLKGH